MKKTLAILAVMASFVAVADYFLFWDTSAYNGTLSHWMDFDNDSSGYDYARLYYTTDSATRASTATDTLAYTGMKDYIYGASDIGSITDGYFYIDIIDGVSGNTLYDGFSLGNVVAYSDLSNYIRESGSPTGVQYWDTAAAIPEPTGGMLVLVGLALLGLRRKRQ